MMQADPSVEGPRPLVALLPLLATLLFAVVLIRTAWVCDDAYITLRTVDNVVNGYGLTWNTFERVQTFTHPLWTLLLSSIYWFTREAYYTTICLSIAVSLAAALVLAFGIARNRWTGLFAILALLLSKPIVDFSTSGLENPLSHLLLFIFLAVYFRGEPSLRRLTLLTFVAALAALNRQDTIIIYLPALVWLWWRLRRGRATVAVIGGALPLLTWGLFSLWYYGFLLPNTAYAKLATGIPAELLVRQGLTYLWNLALWWPFSALLILLALVFSVSRNRRLHLPLALGIVFYMLYVVRVGGDFMTGRFFTVTIAASIALLARCDFSPARPLGLVAAAVTLVIGLLSPGCPLLNGADYGKGSEARLWHDAIGNERGGYYQHTGLLVQDGQTRVPPNHRWVLDGLKLNAAHDTTVWRTAIGFLGYFAGPRARIIDPHALSDPLLARLPCRQPYHWRIGHFNRLEPEGYVETIRDGHNRIVDDSLARYYDRLSLVTQGSLTSLSRLLEIIRFNLGLNDHLIASYCASPTLVIPYDQIKRVQPVGSGWASVACKQLPPGGLRVPLDSLCHAPLLEIGRDINDPYDIRLLRDSIPLWSTTVLRKTTRRDGLTVDFLFLDSLAAARGYNTIDIIGHDGDSAWAVGYVLLHADSIGDGPIRTLIRMQGDPVDHLRSAAVLPAAGYVFGLVDTTHAPPTARAVAPSTRRAGADPYAAWDSCFVDSLAITEILMRERPDSTVFYFVFSALRPLHANYIPYFRVFETENLTPEGKPQLHIFDFTPEIPSSAWIPGQPIVCRRAIPRLAGQLDYHLALFGKWRLQLGQTLRGTLSAADRPD